LGGLSRGGAALADSPLQGLPLACVLQRLWSSSSLQAPTLAFKEASNRANVSTLVLFLNIVGRCYLAWCKSIVNIA